MPEFEAINEGETGSFFIENDIDDLEKNIRQWCSIQPEEREGIRKKARKTIIDEWSVDYQLSILDQILV